MSSIFDFRLLIEYVEDEDNKKMEEWTGFVLAAGMLLVASLQTICLQNTFQMTYVTGMRIRTAVISAVYRKVIKDISAIDD